MNLKLNKLLLVLLSGLFTIAALPAKADVIGFTGAYDVSNWTTSYAVTDSIFASLGGGGSVDTSGAPTSIVLIEPDCSTTGCTGGQEYGVQFHTVAAFDAIFSFDFNYNTDPDACCSAAYVYAGDLNTAETFDIGPSTLSNNGNALAGTFSVAVLAGDIIGFGNFTNDDCCGANTLTISNFSLTSTSVPEPGALILLSLGLLGVASRRKSYAA